MTAHVAKLIAGKVLYGVVCLFAAVLLVVAGYAHKVVGQVNATGQGITIKGSSSSVTGAMNILVMGLESRTDFQGQTLPNSLLTAMHAGNASAVSAGQVGSQDTNTLILIHVFAGGKKAVGFSIPRDDLVTFPQTYDGQTEGKIDGAYAYAYVQYVSQNFGKESNDDLYLHANQAGQAATIATVSAVTGQKIDHFVEVNLAGFYYLAAAFNGIEVCIQPYPGNNGLNLTDYDPFTGTDNSGFNAYKDGYNKKKGGPQYLHLAAAQSLAFVRSRDTLPGTDLGRTKRQQAVIDYVIFELKHEGVFGDLGQAELAARHRRPVPDHGRALQPARLRHRHARAERTGPVLHDAALHAGEQCPGPGLPRPAGRQHHRRARYPEARGERVRPAASPAAGGREDGGGQRHREPWRACPRPPG